LIEGNRAKACCRQSKQRITGCRWAVATICPPPLSSPWAPKRLASPSSR